MESSKVNSPNKKDDRIVYDLNVIVPFDPSKDDKTDIEARCDAIVANIIKEIDKTFAKK